MALERGKTYVGLIAMDGDGGVMRGLQQPLKDMIKKNLELIVHMI